MAPFPDEVLGVDGWHDRYKVLTDGSVVCRLSLRLGDTWISKMDVGSPSEQPDNGDRWPVRLRPTTLALCL